MMLSIPTLHPEHFWFIVIIGGLINYLYRASFIVGWKYIRLPEWVHQALELVPAAALSAIIAPLILVAPDNTIPPEWVAGAAAIAFSFWRDGLLLPLMISMAVLHLGYHLWGG